MNCLVVDDDPMSRAVMEHYVQQHDALTLAGTCESAVEAANELRRRSIDILFLDVEMPEMSGLDLIRNVESLPPVVLVTSKEKYAVEAFDAYVADYLVKPVTYARFVRAVQRVSQKREVPESASNFVFIKTEGRLVKVDLRTILWIEAQGDYVMLMSQDGKHLVHGTMKGMAEKLPADDFARVHRSYIVRIDQIKDIEDTTIVVGGKVIPIGASYRSGLHDRLNLL